MAKAKTPTKTAAAPRELSARMKNVLRELKREATRANNGGLVPAAVVNAQDGRVIKGIRDRGVIEIQRNGNYKINGRLRGGGDLPSPFAESGERTLQNCIVCPGVGTRQMPPWRVFAASRDALRPA
jgi:hypothetical protein